MFHDDGKEAWPKAPLWLVENRDISEKATLVLRHSCACMPGSCSNNVFACSEICWTCSRGSFNLLGGWAAAQVYLQHLLGSETKSTGPTFAAILQNVTTEEVALQSEGPEI